ncbi:hypothetical protein BJ508DRAFT_68527 [Ascobolus immersus RN42]|uniref:Uncharacterized protein n=1 Tax=Ascobolus immersus RN42 TaxID=1160509 RepID=A0A3N4HST2_ASCIM|nr:hypothetical protein BJ508DRAFT_68527 [Ascobolus immersus RN42]
MTCWRIFRVEVSASTYQRHCRITSKQTIPITKPFTSLLRTKTPPRSRSQQSHLPPSLPLCTANRTCHGGSKMSHRGKPNPPGVPPCPMAHPFISDSPPNFRGLLCSDTSDKTDRSDSIPRFRNDVLTPSRNRVLCRWVTSGLDVGLVWAVA